MKILAQVEDTEALIDRLEKYCAMLDGLRIVLLPLAASIPRLETPEEKTAKEKTFAQIKSRAGRVSREELYAQISDSVKLANVYLNLPIR
ncbi:MAG: hypothetical protein BZ151_05650 [Desulfobacca sp. 4484_104]|nr:MAG: hypothetical protein BZ151_05650 [Desulfobacca sp. 4484_104]RLA88507.1 MAG: hypothetical protein DRG58_07825 [Deltaproteobacteria bacterium]